MKSLNELISEATRLFQNRLKIQNPATAETLAGEIAKDMIPSSSKELLLLAARNLSLALDEPTQGPAFDGRANAINIIAANLRDLIYQALVNPGSPNYSQTHFPSQIYELLSSQLNRNDSGDEMERTYRSLLQELQAFRESFYTKKLYKASGDHENDS